MIPYGRNHFYIAAHKQVSENSRLESAPERRVAQAITRLHLF